MRRLYLVWLWSRLTRQHKMSWWEVRAELLRDLERDRAEQLVREYLTTRGYA